MPIYLRREEIMTIKVLTEKEQNHCEIARTLGVTEGAVRYHLRRTAQGAQSLHRTCSGDGRKDRPFKAEALTGVIQVWMEGHQGRKRPINVRELYEELVLDWGYEGSYRSVLRYVRARYPKPKIRTYRRVETPPGAQVQTDWAEYPQMDVGKGVEPLSALVMVLSHSRKPGIVWSRRQDQLSWLSCHNAAFRRLDGIPAVNRIDNVKTAIAYGAGAWGVINPTYRAYARAVGFHIDACPPREPQAKGKVEAKVRLSRLLVGCETRGWRNLEELQSWTDQRVERWATRAVCPATGKRVQESWHEERQRLAPLPILPEPFDLVVTRRVHKDCMVRFEDHLYPVPFRYVGECVEVRGCAAKVQIMAEGRVVREYPRHTPERILIDPSCYEGQSTERVLPPPPLGKMGRKLQEIMDLPVEQRPVDLYAALVEVAR